MDALDFSQQSQFTQTQPQTQQQSQPAPSASSRFPPSLWGILLSVSSSSSSSSANHDPSAPPPPGAPAGPSSRPTARVLLPRPDRLDLVKGREAYTVGRSPRCDLVLNGPKISSFQARIALGEDGVVRLEDTSTNGTFVRMRKVRVSLSLCDEGMCEFATRRDSERGTARRMIASGSTASFARSLTCADSLLRTAPHRTTPRPHRSVRAM